jgi:hypothetical protein
MTSEIRISTQFYENYGEVENPRWKAKGERIFTLEVDDDYFYYDEKSVEVVKQMINKYSNDIVKFEYRSYEISFFEPIVLDAKIFEELVSQPSI